MNAEQFEQIAVLLQSNIEEAEKQLIPFLSDPQSIFFLLQIIETPPSAISQRTALTLISQSIQNNISALDEETRSNLVNSLIQLSFTNEANFIKLSPILFAYIKKDLQKCVQIIEMSEKFLAEGQFPLTSILFLEKIIPCFDPESSQSFLSSHFENFLNFSLTYLQSEDWKFVVPSMRIFFYTIALIPPESRVDYPHYSIIFNRFPDESNKNNFSSFWAIIEDAISLELIPDNYIVSLYSWIMQTVNQKEVSYESKILLISILKHLIPKFNEEQLGQILNAVFSTAREYVEQENNIPTDYFSTINTALTHLPREGVYSMIKERVMYFLQLQDRSGLVISIFVFSLVLEYAQDAAYKDSEFIITTLMQALNIQDNLLSTAVCEVLESFGQSFTSISIFAVPFIPRIIPFLISEDKDLRQKANDALNSLTKLINIPLEGFFHALWELRDNIPPDEYNTYLEFLAIAVDKSDDFGDPETEALKSIALPALLNLDDVETATDYLPLVSNLICQNEALLPELLGPALVVLMNCIEGQESSEDSVVNCFDFICNLLDKFGAQVAESFKQIIEKGLELLKDDEEGTKDAEPGAVSSRIQTVALDACCRFAKKTEDKVLASKLQEYCIDFFTRDYFEDQDNANDEDEKIDDIVEEIEENSIKEASESCRLIVKLLNDEDKRQLFLNILTYLIQTENPNCASYSIPPLIKILHNASDEQQRQFYLAKCAEIIQLITTDSLPSLRQNIFSGDCDFLLMTNISYLLCEVVRYKSVLVDQLCQFMIQIISSGLNSAYLYCFIGAYSDVIKYGTGSAESNQAIINLLPTLFKEARDPDTKQNLAYLLIILVQNNPQVLPSLGEFIAIMQQWYLEGKENPNGYQLMLSNIASAYLTFFANGLDMNTDLLNEAISEFPPFDTHETEPMLLNLAKIFSSATIPLPTLEIAAFALAKFFILNEEDLKKRKVTPELIGVAQHIFRTIASSNPQIIQQVLAKYSNSQVKTAKLTSILS